MGLNPIDLDPFCSDSHLFSSKTFCFDYLIYLNKLLQGVLSRTNHELVSKSTSLPWSTTPGAAEVAEVSTSGDFGEGLSTGEGSSTGGGS